MATLENLRNIVLCGHGGAGKTSLADSFLSVTGTVSGQHSVENGNSICDFDPEERKHKYSIETALVHFEYAGCHFNLLDTPGYPDFIGQAISALRAAETALLVINAHSGIQVNTRRMFKEAGQAGLGRMIVINKLDDENARLDELVSQIQETFGPQCVLFNYPNDTGAKLERVTSVLAPPPGSSGTFFELPALNERLVETIVQVDDQMLERYFEGHPPTLAELSGLIPRAVASGALIPIICCSAKTGVGVAAVLEAVKLAGLSPRHLPRQAKLNDAEVMLTAEPSGPLCAQVFRTRIDPFVQKLSFIRVYSGTLKRDETVTASHSRKGIKLGPILSVQGEQTAPVECGSAGEIIAIAKMEDLHVNTVLGDFQLPPIQFPTPMVSLAVTPKNRGDETKLSSALHKIVEEDPTFHLDRDPQTKELIMTGMSELHLTIIRERLLRRDKLEVETKQPRIAFRETIQQPAEGSYRHKKQSGGRGQFGEVHIRMLPLPRGIDIKSFAGKDRFPSIREYHYDPKSNFLWVDSIVGGTIPGNFLPAIGKGFAERIESGVVAGYPVQDLCIEVHFGKYHDVDSSEAAFKTAARQAFRQVFAQARPSLLEPIVKLDITIPETHVGDVFSDMSGRGGRVVGSDSAGGGFSVVHCEVPLREVTTYARTLSSMTGGMGTYSMEFSHYEPMPANVQHELITKSTVAGNDDE